MRFCTRTPGPLPETKSRKDMMAPWGAMRLYRPDNRPGPICY
nr:MAG TPA: hypothetical protein [Caudoviricetes sp.]